MPYAIPLLRYMEHPNLCSLPRLVIAAPHGRSGKTTTMLALVAALTARGLVVQPFKKGPDYIDPSWLTAAARRPARNLDSFMLDNGALISGFARGAVGADIVLIEGNHGLYDSLDDAGNGSTAALARLYAAPILLVVDSARMGRSVAALVEGYQYFEPDTNVAGVILNNVAQPRHRDKLQRAIEQHCGIPVVGMLPRAQELSIPDRHLGLIPHEEYERAAIGPLELLRRSAEEYFDLDGILAIAHSAGPLDVPAEETSDFAAAESCQIGVLRDAAFSFYYPENLEALTRAGAKLVFVDSLNDARLPCVDALYIGGGFPEVFAEQLEANASLRADVSQAVKSGLPVYAECGGLLYLSRSIQWGSRVAAMAGGLPCDIQVLNRPQGHGYVEARVVAPTPFFAPGALLRGHEYHHSRVVNLDLPLAYQLTRGRGIADGCDGIVYRKTLAAYTHLHALGTPDWATSFVEQAEEG